VQERVQEEEVLVQKKRQRRLHGGGREGQRLPIYFTTKCATKKMGLNNCSNTNEGMEDGEV
jgi:hypothetical protein